MVEHAPHDPEHVRHQEDPEADFPPQFSLRGNQPRGRNTGHHGGPLHEIEPLGVHIHWMISEDWKTAGMRIRCPVAITWEEDVGGTPFPKVDAVVARQDGSGPECSRSEEHTSELQSRGHLVCRLLLEKKYIIHFIMILT